MLILSTCFYLVKNKYNLESYIEWMKNLLLNVIKFKLVVYKNKESCIYIKDFCKDNNNITIVIKEFEEFYNYKYMDKWISNQNKNINLKTIDWKLNMIWCEKIHFVYHTIEIMKNFQSKDWQSNDCWYGWCDIGYFRGRNCDINNNMIAKWPNYNILDKLDKTKIYYNKVNDLKHNFKELVESCLYKNEVGLPKIPIKPDQVSIAGGFFLCRINTLLWWRNTFDNKLKLYFDYNYLIKDDQMLILNCYAENEDKFILLSEERSHYDNWFTFQRFLL